MYFQHYFANKCIKLESFTSHLQHLRPYCIRYTTLAFGSCCKYEHVKNLPISSQNATLN